MTTQLSILMPLYDEEELLPGVVGELLERLPSLDLSFEILLLENGSHDRTFEIARQLEAKNPSVVRAFHVETPDYGAAITNGLSLARGEFGVVFEIDFIDLEFVRRGLLEFQSDVDMVIGSKMHPQSQDERPFTRKLYTYSYNLLLYLLFGFRGHETHGLKVFRIAPLLQSASSCVTSGDTFTTEWVIRCQWAGSRILERPVSIREIREPRISPIKRIPYAIRNLMQMIDAMELRGPLLRMCVWVICLTLAVFAISRYAASQAQRNFGPDEGTYTYVGWSWANGYWPYLSSWDHKGPMVYATTMLRTLVAGTEPESLAAQEIVLGLTAAILVAGIAFYLWGSIGSAVAFALAIVLWSQFPPEYGHMSTPGSLLVLFAAGSIFAALATTRVRQFRASVLFAVISGLCSGLAICTKPNAVVGLVVGVAVIFLAGHARSKRDRMRLVVYCLLSFLLPIITFASIFYYSGALGALADNYLSFNSIRGRLMLEGNNLHIVLMSVKALNDLGLVPLVVAILVGMMIAAIRGLFSQKRIGLMSNASESIIPVWLLIELATLLMSGGYRHHVYPVLPAVALGGAWLVVAPLRGGLLPIRAWFVVMFFLVFTSPMLAVATMQPPGDNVERRSANWNWLVRTMAAETDPSDRVLTFDNWSGPGILSIIHRRNASRYCYPIPMYTRGYASDARWAEMLSEIQDHTPPKVLLISSFGLQEPAEGGKTVEWALGSFDRARVPTELVDRTLFPNRDRLKNFIAGNYHLEHCAANLCLLRHN